AGQGGNSCIESCTTIVNSPQEQVLPGFYCCLDSRPNALSGLRRWSATPRLDPPDGLDLLAQKLMLRYVLSLLPKAATVGLSHFVTPAVLLYGDSPRPLREHAFFTMIKAAVWIFSSRFSLELADS
ncbi:hypothetical protein MCOR14_003386, partial [Pyricularia oryzae]